MSSGNYAVAYHLWRPLADRGDPEACYSLGWMYHNGHGLAINDRKAETLWLRAVAQGHSGAMFSLGNLYSLGGKNVPQNYKHALDLWEQAASLGNLNARQAIFQMIAMNLPEVDTLLPELISRTPYLFNTTRIIDANRVNLRDGPGKQHQVLNVLTRGNPLVELARRGSWVKIGIADPPQVGWIYTDLTRVEK